MATEMCRLQTAVQKESFERNGYKEYMFITSGEGNVCPDCEALHGQHFKVSEMQAGVNAPPMHPRCHCSAAGYMDSDKYERWIDALARGEDVRWNEFEEWEAHLEQTEKELIVQEKEKNRIRTYGKAPIYERSEVVDKCESFEDIKELFPEISFFNNFNKMPIAVQKEVAQGFYYMRELFGDKALPWTCGSSKINDYGKTKLRQRKITINSSISVEDAFSTACHECIHVMDYNRGLLSDRIIEKARKKLGLKDNSRSMDQLVLDFLGWELYTKYRHDNSELIAYAFEEYLYDSDNVLVMDIIEQFIGELR